MSNDYFIKKVHEHRLYLFIIMLVGLAVSLLLYKYERGMYTGTASFYVSARPEIDFHGDIESAYTEPNFSVQQTLATQQMFLNSSEMNYALIKQFHLYSHYRIDTTQPYAYEKVTRQLKGNIKLSAKEPICLFDLNFRDRNETIAVNLVNFVVAKLQQMNKEAIFNKLKARVQFYKLILDNANGVSEKISQRLVDQIKMFNEIIKSPKFNQDDHDKLLSFQNSLSSLTSDLKQANQSILSVNNMYQLSIKGMQDDDFPIINPVQKAYPQGRTDGNFAIQFAFVGFFGTGIIYLLVLWFVLTYKRELKMIFTGHE